MPDLVLAIRMTGLKGNVCDGVADAAKVVWIGFLWVGEICFGRLKAKKKPAAVGRSARLLHWMCGCRLVVAWEIIDCGLN